MCQVGVRCYTDSNAKLKAETKRLANVEESIKACQEDIAKAGNSNDLESYSKARKRLSELNIKREQVIFKRNAARRDVDGTKKGRDILEQQMMKSKSYEEFEQLQLRKQQGEATAFVRAYSAKHKSSGRPSPIFLPGDKKPARRVVA